MLAKLIEASLLQRLLVLVASCVLVGLGLQATGKLPIDAFPDVSPTQVKIILKAPGMTPEEVESRIVQPVEQELLGIPGQRSMRSVSKYAIADITIDFEEGTDIYWARQQVGERFANAQGNLPANVGGGLAPVTTPLGEMFMFTVEGPLSLQGRRALLDWTIRPALRGIAGVADVNSLGGSVRAFEVVPDPVKLAARGLSMAQLREALTSNNRNDGAGRLIAGEEALLVRAEGSIKSLGDVAATAIAQRDGVVLRVGDVAEVRMGSLTRYGAVTRDGKGETVQGLVLGLRGADAGHVVEQVKARLDELSKTLPKGVRIEPFYDRGALVGHAVETVGKALLEAIVLVMILLLLFLGQWRPALVVAVVLPLSALATFWLMRQTGLSANLMSLGGLAIAIGMLVDSAVVVVENIEAKLAHPAHPEHGQPPGSLIRLVRMGAEEVATPVASGVLIIMLVFLPLLTLEGLEGKLFKPVALTILYAMGASLVLSLTLIPVLASLMLKLGSHEDPWLVRKLNSAYVKLLDGALRRPTPWVVGTVLALVGSGVAFALLGKSFMPTMDEGDVIVSVEQAPAIHLGEALRLNTQVQKALMVVPEVRGIVARSGSDELGLDPMGLNQTDTFLVLKPKAEWQVGSKEELLDRLREQLALLPGVATSFTQPIEMRVNEMILGVRGDVAVKIYGPDLATLSNLATQVEHVLQKTTGSEDVQLIQNSGLRYLRVIFDRQALGRHGLSIEQAQDDLRTLLESSPTGFVLEQGRRIPLIVRGPSALAVTPELFAQLQLPVSGGAPIALSQLARLEETEGPVKIDRENGARFAAITTNVRGRDLVSFVEDAQNAVRQQVKLPEGYAVTWGGQYENQQRAAKRLAVVVPVALGLIFLILYATFGSTRQAMLVFLNIPLALIGGVFALAAAGEYLSVPASVGFIALMGIAVLNGLVLVNHFNELLAQGHSLADAVRNGSIRRLRPVLMTASITAFGLLPLLFATGPGSEIQRPLAIVVIGGLVSSTALTLVLLPILFRRFGLSQPEASQAA
jgi:cobalt-zinc-cadmium resistance protein CzcA